MIDRRQLIKRSIAGGLAALVGLPEGKAEKAANSAPLLKMRSITSPGGVVYMRLVDVPTIRHTGKFRLYRETIEVPPKELPWRHYKPGALFVEIQGHWMTGDEWSRLDGHGPVRLELTGDDYDLTAIGTYEGVVVTAWMDGPAPSSAPKYYGDFTFRLILPIEEVVVKKQFPAEQDDFNPFDGCTVTNI